MHNSRSDQVCEVYDKEIPATQCKKSLNRNVSMIFLLYACQKRRDRHLPSVRTLQCSRLKTNISCAESC